MEQRLHTTSSRKTLRTRLVAALALGASALAMTGCGPEGGLYAPKHMTPVSAELRALMADKGMDKSAPILMRLYKADAKLEVWKKQRSTGKYALLKSFDICRWSGDLGPKVKEGDRQAPEGFYTITPGLMNPNSSYHLAFNTGFPNAFDKAHGRYGSHLMVHGDCTSRGCYAMTNAQVQDIYALARDAFEGGQKGFQLQLYPFRMNAENLHRYRKNQHIAFWKNLKEGSDHFEVTGQEPQVAVCAKKYVFNQIPKGGTSFSASEACPATDTPAHIASAVNERAKHDNAVMAALEHKADHSPSSSLMARLSGRKHVKPGTPPHQIYLSRAEVRSSLPTASPEALSLLPGVEAGPTLELRRIAKGEIQGTPANDAADAPPQVTASLPASEQRSPTMSAATTPRTAANAPVPMPSPLRPDMVAEAKPAEPAPANNGWFSRLTGFGSKPVESAPAAVTAAASGQPAPGAPMPQPSPLRTVAQAANAAPALNTTAIRNAAPAR